MSAGPVPVTFVIDGPKISAYLLNPQHARGASKAKYLLGFGFSQADPKGLVDALVQHAFVNAPGTMKPQPEGLPRIVIEGPAKAPDGRAMPLRTVWEPSQVETELRMRFITAVPLTR